MSRVELFFEDAVSDLRRQLAAAGDAVRRTALEDRIALLTDYRLAGLDEPQFERLLGTLQAGRSPVGLRALAPYEVALDLQQRWHIYCAEGIAQARN